MSRPENSPGTANVDEHDTGIREAVDDVQRHGSMSERRAAERVSRGGVGGHVGREREPWWRRRGTLGVGRSTGMTG
jgi:hypothetical protein